MLCKRSGRPSLRMQALFLSGGGPARTFFGCMRRSDVYVSIVTFEEFYEKRGHEVARELASRFSVMGLHVGDALQCRLLQTRSARRLGENDAWLAEQYLRGGCSIVTRDRRFDDVSGLDVLNS